MADQLSGRELDAAVAERVMGWTVIRVPDRPNRFDSIPADRFPVFAMWAEGGTALYESQHDIRSFDFRPSESIEAAMRAVTKLSEKGCSVTMSSGDTRTDKEWFVEFITGDQRFLYTGEAASDCLPEAICLAALDIAVELDKNQT